MYQVIFIGINDCGTADSADELEPIVETVFDTVHDLYIKAKARHFVLIDVPPIDRSPQGTPTLQDIIFLLSLRPQLSTTIPVIGSKNTSLRGTTCCTHGRPSSVSALQRRA